jgi:hypothetical protein
MIRRRTLAAGVLAAAALLPAACAPTPPPAARAAPGEPDAAAAAAADRGVTLRAEPLATPARQREALGNDLSRRGVVALLVRVENGGPVTIDLRARDLALERNEARIRAAGPAMIGGMIGEGAGVTAAGLAGAALLGVPGGLLASAAAGESNRQAMRSQSEAFAAIGLRDGPVPPGGSASGYVFFTPPPAMGAFDDAALVLRSGDPALPGGIVIRLPLTGLNHRPPG